MPMQRLLWRALFILLLAAAAWFLVGGPPEPPRPRGQSLELRADSAEREVPKARKVSAPRGAPLWSQTATLTPRENAEAHWEKHRREFPEYQSAQEYIEGAHLFLRGPPESTLRKTRSNGDRLFYDPQTNTFAVQARNGAPRTFFRPSSGIRYWNRQ